MKAAKKASGLRKVFRVIAFGWSVSPSYVLLSLARSLVKSFIPYVPIYCSYLIIDGLVAKQEASAIMVIVYWMISLTLGLSLLKVYLEHLLQAYGQKIRVLVNRRISEKTFSLSYAQLQDQATLHLIQEAHDGSNGYGIWPRSSTIICPRFWKVCYRSSIARSFCPASLPQARRIRWMVGRLS
jgi:ABC-type bacteriocin/lantibiotic exporter with double-glycine peptidase domain